MAVSAIAGMKKKRISSKLGTGKRELHFQPGVHETAGWAERARLVGRGEGR